MTQFSLFMRWISIITTIYDRWPTKTFVNPQPPKERGQESILRANLIEAKAAELKIETKSLGSVTGNAGDSTGTDNNNHRLLWFLLSLSVYK